MLLYPKYYFNNVQSIDLELLKKDNILGLILDVDNTLIDYERRIPQGIKPWIEKAKGMNFKIIILSNSNKKDKISKVASELSLEYIMLAQKPLKKGFIKALKWLNLKPENCVAIGDQIFTDVIGANVLGINSLYVEPINKAKEYWYTSWKRPIEDIVIKKYKKVVR